MVVVGVMVAVEEVVEEIIVADEDFWIAVDISIGVVDVYVSFVLVCVVEVAGLAVVIFVRGEATKFKQRARRIKKFDAPLNM